LGSRTLIVIVLNLLGVGGLYFALRPAPTTSGDSASTEPSAGEARERIYGVKIKDGAMSLAEISVNEGVQVTLRWTSDIPVEVHVHGYDLEEEVSPGEETDLSFEANLAGRFEIEEHETETELGALLVQPR
jgi:heme/copper-type cytochrome/quinol oxidase subunit 2